MNIENTLAAVAVILILAVGTWQGWPWYTMALGSFGLFVFQLLRTFERRAADARYLAFVATMSALAAVSRAVVQGIPGVQPATFFVIVSGYCFGPATGIMVGALTAVGSNVFLGEGGWTPWQMLAWGLAGATAGWLRIVIPTFSRRWLVPFGVLWGYLFGWIMNTWSLLIGPAVSWKTYLLLCFGSVWFDTLHALATGALLFIAGQPVYRILERFRRRMTSSRFVEPGLPPETIQ